jgi:hypothetical protein
MSRDIMPHQYMEIIFAGLITINDGRKMIMQKQATILKHVPAEAEITEQGRPETGSGQQERTGHPLHDTIIIETRQVLDIPPLHYEVTEHQVLEARFA